MRLHKKLILLTLLVWSLFCFGLVYAGGVEPIPATGPFPDAMKFYVRGDVGNAFFASGSTTVISPPPAGILGPFDFFAAYEPSSSVNFTSTLGLGWNMNQYLRFDAMWITFQEHIEVDSTNVLQIVHSTTRGRANLYLFNAYLNLGPFLHFSHHVNLYIGAGAGYSNNKLANLDNYVLNAAPPGFSTFDGASRREFAWRAILGTAYQFTHSLLFNVEYSYISAGHFESGEMPRAGGGTSGALIGVPKFKMIVNQITVGLIYLI